MPGADVAAGADVLADARWTLHRHDPDGTVADAPDPALADPAGGGIPARVPGTVSGALRDVLGEDAVDAQLRAGCGDTAWEYRTRVVTPGGPYRFRSAGVATVARLLVAEREVHVSETAFTPWDVVVQLPAGACEIVLRIEPTTSVAVPRRPRARWLSPLVPERSVRWRRTPLVGFIDWPGARPVLGPWGGLTARAEPSTAPLDLSSCTVSARVAEDGAGLVSVRLVSRVAAATAPASAPSAEPAPSGVPSGTSPAAPPGDSPGQTLRGAARPEPDAEPAGATVRVVVSRADADDDTVVRLEHTVTSGDRASDGTVTVAVRVPEPDLWWPHGMGGQSLYRVRVGVGVGGEHTETTVGFRTVSAEHRDAEHRGLALRVNGVPVFVRGAVWTGSDPFETAADPRRTRAVLQRLRAAGLTMLRCPGTGCYESEDFHRACDELGLMVWQDVALGPLDPPDEPHWREGLRSEVRSLAARLGAHPSTAVVSGGTEVIQAPVLAGRPAEQWTPEVLLHDVPTAVGEALADAVVVPSSPCSDAQLDAAAAAYESARDRAASEHAPAGCRTPNETLAEHEDAPPTGDIRDAALLSPEGAGAPLATPEQAGGAASSSGVPAGSPVDAADGVCHYFGVGAYGRPLEDAVTRGVRFAAEALAFAVPPEPAVVRAQFGTDGPLDTPAGAAAWRRGLARDPGAAWTFEDTTTTYVHRLFLDRDSDPDAALAAPARPAEAGALGGHAQMLEHERAALAHVFQRSFAQWRAADSPCRGALVLAAASTAPGAGWGVLDVTGRPTAAWYGMRRACAPVAVCFVPAGGDGLPVHVWNDGAEPLDATLQLTVATVRGGSLPPIDVPVTVPARGGITVRADLADGTFRDLDHAYGFGGREFDAVGAVLLDASGNALARDVHLSGGPRRNDPEDPGLRARWHRNEDGSWAVAVSAERLARFVALGLPVGAPEDDPEGAAPAVPGGGTIGNRAPAAAAADVAPAVAEDGYVHLLPGETLHLPVSGEATDAVRRGTVVRALGAAPVTVAGD